MLYIIQVGHVEASDRYIRNKIKAIKDAGLEAELVNLNEDCTTHDVIESIKRCYLRDHNCKAIMVQLPLPDHIDAKEVLTSIPPKFDIDGLNPRSDYRPLTPCAIMRWLSEQGMNLRDQSVCILGRSDLVGKPLANLMIEAGATVSVLNSKTQELIKKELLSASDIVISAVGKAGVLNMDDFFSFPHTIVDVGINRDENGKLCGDVNKNLKAYMDACGRICTPVPGGVGKWTVQELVLRLKNMEKVSR